MPIIFLDVDGQLDGFDVFVAASHIIVFITMNLM